MKKNQCTFKIIIVFLMMSKNCYAGENLSKKSLELDLTGAVLPKECLMLIGAAADDKTRDNCRHTCKFLVVT